MTSRTPSPSQRREILRNPVCLAAFGFGAGLMSPAPGTWGTAVAIPVYLLLAGLAPVPYILVVTGLFLVGVWLCSVCARKLAVHDHPGIVWDEIVGFLIAAAGVGTGWNGILLAFLLFRFFDIVKPWPIRALDRHVPGGLGIMIDDVLAGLFAWALTRLIL